ncbi:MAG: GNAT family N-acetyltransferase [Gammaproteobacteria bacterium]|nr:GNAT family N-acetyltransferase [Gammaproteobacteria bacterium]
MTALTLHPTVLSELDSIISMERQPDAVDFLILKSREEHLREMQSPGGTYLSIYWEDEMVGYLSLIEDPDGMSIECRRIVVARSGQGIGGLTMQAMEVYCREALGRSRIWLDFFSHNTRGQHVYEKHGYQEFGKAEYEGKVLRLYEKFLT